MRVVCVRRNCAHMSWTLQCGAALERKNIVFLFERDLHGT
jgi:hypothetical protein